MDSSSAVASDGAASTANSYGRLLLPIVKLKHGANSKLLEQRFNYLWSSAHAMLATSPTIAHKLAATIMETARQERVLLPPAVLDYLCQQCGGLVVPSISADVNVIPQHHKSPIARKLARQQRKFSKGPSASSRRELLQNVLSIRCRRCGFANLRHGATIVHKPREKKTPKRPLGEPTDSQPATKKAMVEAPSAPVSVQDESTSTSIHEESTAPVAPPPTVPVVRSVFAKPPSPPRKLLEGKKKKKKPSAATSAATATVKSSLNSFLQTLRK